MRSGALAKKDQRLLGRGRASAFSSMAGRHIALRSLLAAQVGARRAVLGLRPATWLLILHFMLARVAIGSWDHLWALFLSRVCCACLLGAFAYACTLRCWAPVWALMGGPVQDAASGLPRVSYATYLRIMAFICVVARFLQALVVRLGGAVLERPCGSGLFFASVIGNAVGARPKPGRALISACILLRVCAFN